MSSAGSSADSGATAAAPGGQRLVGVHSSVIVHPLVLLSVVDHSGGRARARETALCALAGRAPTPASAARVLCRYRVQRDLTSKRVLGVLLGEAFQGRVVRCAAGSSPF